MNNSSEFLGKTFEIKSRRTGQIVSKKLAIASSFPTVLEYQTFLIELYLKDIDYYKTYTTLILGYLISNPDDLPHIDILQNTTIISTINTMYLLRDKEEYEKQEQEHLEMQQFIQSLTKKQK